MNKLTAIIALIIIIIGSVGVAAVPDLYVNDLMVDPSIYRLTGENDDLVLTLESDRQTWQILTERTPNRMFNSFGIYTDLYRDFGPGKSGVNTTTIMQSHNSGCDIVNTSFAEGTDVGFWLLSDLSSRGVCDNNSAYLFSERALTRNSYDNNKQWFLAYDVASFGNSKFKYGDFCFKGNYDYLLFIDDNEYGPNYDHNDMVIGLSNIPEPGTLLLLGTGLIGTGIIIRRQRKNS